MGQDGARREIRQAFHPSGASGVSIPGSGWGKLSMRHVCPVLNLHGVFLPFASISPFHHKPGRGMTSGPPHTLSAACLLSTAVKVSFRRIPASGTAPARPGMGVRTTGVREGRTNTSVLPGAPAPALFSPSPSAGAEWRARMRSHPSVSRASHRR